MKKIRIISILTITVLFAACTNENVIEQIDESECLNSARITVDDFVFDNTTRAAISNTLAFTWTKSKDVIGVWPTLEAGEEEIASQVQFKASSGGSASAVFSGTGWGLMPNRRYFAYYPYKESARANRVAGNYGISYTQSANNNTSHLGSNVILYTSATAPSAKDTAQFQFHHLGSVMKMEISVPEESKSKVFKQVVFSTEEPMFIRAYSFNPCAEEPSVTAESRVNELTLTLGSNGAGFTPVDGKLSVWFLIGAVDLTGVDIKVKAVDTSGKNYSGTVAGVAQAGGKAHLYELNVQ